MLLHNYTNITIQSAAYLYDAMKILSKSVAEFERMNPNLTQIQQSCDSLEIWQFSDTFQTILEKVTRFIAIVI